MRTTRLIQKSKGKILFAFSLAVLLASVGALSRAQTTPSLTVVSPNGGECVTSGTSFSILWGMSGVDHVKIYYSPTGISSNKYFVQGTAAGQTSYSWIAPYGDSSSSRIFLEGLDPTGIKVAEDGSDGVFTVLASCAGSPSPSPAPADTTPPTITNVRAESISKDGAQVKWDTNESADSKVIYGTSLGNYPSSLFDGAYMTGHSISLASLLSATTYYYRVISKDAANNIADIGGFSFTTLAGMSGTGGGTASPSPSPSLPSVMGFGVNIETSGATTIGVSFSQDMDQSTFNTSNIKLYPEGQSSNLISGTIQKANFYFSYILSQPLGSNTKYVLWVSKSVKNLSGMELASDYQCTFQGGSGYTSCPSTSISPSPSPSPTVFPTAAAGVTGTVVDVAGQVVSGAGVHVFNEAAGLNFGAMTDSRGAFRIGIPAGSYVIEIFPPFGRTDLARPAPIEVSVISGETKTVAFKFATFATAAKSITGIVSFSNGNPITDAEVGAYSGLSGQWVSTFTDAHGYFAIRVGPGRWVIGLRPVDPVNAKWHWSGPFEEATFLPDDSTETKTVYFVIPLQDAKVIARVIDQSGNAIPNAGVVLDTVSGGYQGVTKPYIPPEFRKTDSGGLSTFLVTPGTYYLRAFLPPELGYLNPEEQNVIVSSSQEKEIRLVFRKRETVTAATLSGVAKLEDGTPIDAFLWAWSEKGGSVHGRASLEGRYTFQLPVGDRWHVGAGKEVNGIPYKSTEVIADMTGPAVSIELVLTKFRTELLSPPVSVSQAATQQIVAEAKDGAKISLPPQAALPSGTVTAEIKPTVEAPSQPAAKIVSTVYDIGIKDQAGKPIRELQQEVEIVIPYNESELKAQGVTEDKIVPSFFDDTTGSWVKVDAYTIDKERNVVIIRVKHLTRFALVAPADTVPPAPPTVVSRRRSGAGRIYLAWANPTADFAYAKVYRSSEAGVLGSAVFAKVSANFIEDTGLEIGKTYYYTIRAVDPADNESTNLTQVAVVAGISGEAVSGVKFNKDLFYGMENDPEVQALQEVLRDLGFYKGPLTGNFFSLTQAAVRVFQQTYGIPAVGRAGPLTRSKLESLAVKPSPSPAPGGPFTFLRDLEYGMSNDPDVKALQELLTKLGLYDGPATGNFLNLTRTAIQKFQVEYGIPSVGRVGPQTRAKLNELAGK